MSEFEMAQIEGVSSKIPRITIGKVSLVPNETVLINKNYSFAIKPHGTQPFSATIEDATPKIKLPDTKTKIGPIGTLTSSLIIKANNPYTGELLENSTLLVRDFPIENL